MTKAEVVAEIANKTGIERVTVLATVETMMEVIKENMVKAITCICVVSEVLS